MKKSNERRVGIYPGTFDPITNGHAEIIRRAGHLVDHLIVAVAENTSKAPLFSLEERLSMIEEDIKPMLAKGQSIEVKAFDTLLIHFARENNAGILIRGLRAVSDFDFEFQMAGLNAQLDSMIETVFLMASDRNQFISSSFIREIRRHGGPVDQFVSPYVSAALDRRFKEG